MPDSTPTTPVVSEPSKDSKYSLTRGTKILIGGAGLLGVAIVAVALTLTSVGWANAEQDIRDKDRQLEAVQGSYNQLYQEFLDSNNNEEPSAPTPEQIDRVVGQRGPQGLPGTQGERGPRGEMGVAGQTGPVGASGKDGAPGATGASGEDGANGADGATGATGATGLVGGMGPAGPAGPAGAPGADGATGATGPQGEPGVAGPPGADGVVLCPSGVPPITQTITTLADGPVSVLVCA
jgi:hypothetical protein